MVRILVHKMLNVSITPFILTPELSGQHCLSSVCQGFDLQLQVRRRLKMIRKWLELSILSTHGKPSDPLKYQGYTHLDRIVSA